MAAILASQLLAAHAAYCPGSIDVDGYGPVQLVPHGWFNHSKAFKHIDVVDGAIIPHMGSRAYFATACAPGAYDQSQYVSLPLLGRTLSYTVDLAGAGCGCNAAFYLASMRRSPNPSWGGDYYCDANKVSGIACTEIDIQEANQFAWHSTCHSSDDNFGMVGGFGGYGGKDWTAQEYGPGKKCVDTAKPFQVAVSFPVGSEGVLAAIETVLSQDGHSCPLSMRLEDYKDMAELSTALAEGMTPVVSYWSAENMLWLDGKGNSNGTCREDHKKLCGKTVKFYDFAVSDAHSEQQPTTAPLPAAAVGEQLADPWQEQVRAQQAAEARLERREVAEARAREEARLVGELRAQEAEATAIVVPTLAPLSERRADQHGNIVSNLFKNVFGGFVRRYELRDQFEAHGPGHLVATTALLLGLAAVAATSAAVALVVARRRRSDGAMIYNPIATAGRTLVLDQIAGP